MHWDCQSLIQGGNLIFWVPANKPQIIRTCPFAPLINRPTDNPSVHYLLQHASLMFIAAPYKVNERNIEPSTSGDDTDRVRRDMIRP